MLETLDYSEYSLQNSWRAKLGQGTVFPITDTNAFFECPVSSDRLEMQAPWSHYEGEKLTYSFAFLPDSSFRSVSEHEDNWCVIFQGHQDGISKPPPWSIVVKGNKIRAEHRTATGTRELLSLGDLSFSKPTVFTVVVNSYVKDIGIIKLYRDSTYMGTFVGSNRYTTIDPIRARIGIYRNSSAVSSNIAAWFSPLLVYSGELREEQEAFVRGWANNIPEIRVDQISLLKEKLLMQLSILDQVIEETSQTLEVLGHTVADMKYGDVANLQLQVDVLRGMISNGKR